MARRGDPRVLRFVVLYLRQRTNLTQAQFGRAARVDQSDVSDAERGKCAPSEEALRRMAQVARVPWSIVVQLRRFLTAVLAALDGALPAAGAAPGALDGLLGPLLLAVTPSLLGETVAAPRLPTLEEELQEAAAVVPRLAALPAPRRRRLLELAPRASRNWAVAVGLCHESERRAAHDAAEALELAALALWVAGQVPGAEPWRAALAGYCRAHLGNARRVGNDFDGAELDFARARELWAAGDEAVDGRLAGWRLLDLEASLRREQHRFADALCLLDEAALRCGGDARAAGRLLLQKEHVLEQAGDPAAALAVLTAAAPRIEAAGDPGLLLALRFKTVNNLCHLGHAAEAAALLPAVQRLAAAQGNDLERLRVRWLGARVATVQGRHGEAAAVLQEVLQAMTERALPYDAALAALDLAVLRLQAGRTAEVRELAAGMAWIFEAKKIRREALAALTLFCEAARQEVATVELVHGVAADFRQAWNGAAPAPADDLPRR